MCTKRSPIPLYLYLGPSENWIYTPNKNLNRKNDYHPRILGYPVFRQTHLGLNPMTKYPKIGFHQPLSRAAHSCCAHPIKRLGSIHPRSKVIHPRKNPIGKSKTSRDDWLAVDLTLWKMMESQLGWWHSQLFLEIHKIPWFQTTNQMRFLWKCHLCSFQSQRFEKTCRFHQTPGGNGWNPEKPGKTSAPNMWLFMDFCKVDAQMCNIYLPSRPQTLKKFVVSFPFFVKFTMKSPFIMISIWLVVDLPLWKIWRSVWDDYSQSMEK